MLGLRTILHPTDFSESSDYALQFACGLAADHGANLVIIHVMPAPTVADSVDPQAPGDSSIRAKLNRFEIAEQGIDVIHRVEEGNPAVEILKIAQLCGADLIVMGAQKPCGKGGRFMGSVAEAVLRRANCSVLTVTAPARNHLANDNSQQVAHVC